MGYYLQAFIGKQDALNVLQKQYSTATICKLKQGISIIPMIEDLFDHINGSAITENIMSFEYLTIHVEQAILKHITHHATPILKLNISEEKEDNKE